MNGILHLSRIQLLGLFSLLLLICSLPLAAQIDNSDFKVEMTPDDLGVCGVNSGSAVTVTAKKNTLSDFEIVIDFPDGVDYVAGEFGISSAPAGYTLSEIDISNLNRPRFAISRASNWGIGDQVSFKIERTAGCEAVQFKNQGGGIFKDAQEIYYEDAGVPDTASDFSLTIYTYNLLDPSISIQSISTLSTFVGDTPSRSIEIEQGGQGCLEEFEYYVLVSDDIGNYQLSYLGTPLTPTSTVSGFNGDTLFYTIDISVAPFAGTVGDGDICWENGELITFNEDFEVLGCDNVEIRHHAFWGCSSDQCQQAAPQSGGISFGAGVPVITLTEVTPVTMDLCDTITYTVRIANGTGSSVTAAFDLSVIFGMGANSTPISTPLAQTLWGDSRFGTRNWDSFTLNGFDVTETTIDNGSWSDSWGDPSWIPYDNYATDPDGVGIGLDDIDGDGFYDDLAPGDSVVVTLKYWSTPRSNCGSNRYDYMGWEHHYFDVSYFDQCGEIRPDPKRIDFDYRNFIRDYQITTEFEAPSDVDGGVDFNVMLKPYLYNRAIQCHGEDALVGSFSRWDVRLFLPTGVSLAATDGIDSHFPAGWSPTKTIVPGVGGDTVVYALNRYNFNEYNFLLNMDCATYLAAGGGGTLNIPYETTYYCSDGTDDCWVQKIHCGTFSMTAHCIGGCNGPSTISFDAERTTAGFTDATMSTQVTLDPDIHSLDWYNPADTMLVKTRAIIVDSAVTSLYFDMDYTATAANGGASVIEFVSGSITIDDISAGTFSGAINVAPLITSSGNNHTQTFDLSSYTSIVSPSYDFGDGNQRDTVDIELKFVWSKDFTAAVVNELTGFKGIHYAIHPTTLAEVACDTYGDRAYYHKARFDPSSATVSTSACSSAFTTSYLTRTSGTNDIHPGEYRPPITWDSTLVIIPEGATFGGRVDFYDLAWYMDISSYSISNDSVWVYPPPGFTDIDQRSTYYPRVRVHIFGNCEAGLTDNYDTRFYYTEYAYHPDPSVHESRYREVNNRAFLYTPPTFLFQAPTPNENGFATTVSWDLELCNNATTGVDYNWFRIAQRANLELDSVVNSTSGALLNIVSEGGYDYVEAGALGNTPSCNFYEVFASYTTCEFDTLFVEQGWDCVAYPADYSATLESCYGEPLKIIVEPQEAQIQLAVTDEPATAVALCSQFEVEVEFLSAQISDANDPYLEFSLPGGASGIIIDSVRVEYPQNSGNFQVVPYSIVALTGAIDLMDHTLINANEGLPGTENAITTEDRIATITFYFQLGCDFPSGTSMDFTPFATSPCGDPAIGSGGVTTSNAFFVNGAIAPYDAFTSITVPDMEYCSTSTINFQSTIVGGTTASADTMRITLPVGLSYVSGSITCIGTHCPVGTPVIETEFGFERIFIGLPAGIPDGGLVQFEIDVDHTAAACADPASIGVLTYFSNAGLACASSTCDATPITTGTSSESFVIAKPDLQLATSTASMATLPNGSAYYDVSASILNSGLDALVTYDFDVYCSDGMGGISGPSLYSASMTSILENTQQEILDFEFYSSTPCASDDLVIQILPSAADCLCDTLLATIPVTLLGALPDADGDNVPDDFDIDDDNDGIPDTDEQACHGDTPWDAAALTIGPATITTEAWFEPLPSSTRGGVSFSQFSPLMPPGRVAGVLDADPATQTRTITFSTPINDLYLGILNLDFYSMAITDQDANPVLIEVVDVNANMSIVGNVIKDLTPVTFDSGNSADGVVALIGTFTSLTLTYTYQSPANPNDGHIISFLRIAGCNDIDSDMDGVSDRFDLDSDNDGIYDLVEAGHGENDGNSNGRIDGLPAAFGSNGLFNGVETAAESGLLDYTIADSDGDGAIDSIELDADDDGCNDVIEAGYSDSNGNGKLGDGN